MATMTHDPTCTWQLTLQILPKRVPNRFRTLASWLYSSWLCVACSFLTVAPSNAQEPVGTAFGYQGYMEVNGLRATGLFDFELELYDDPTFGNQMGTTYSADDVVVTDGLFSITPDFGVEPSPTEARWVAVRVREGSEVGDYVDLVPRSRVLPAPIATQASQAANADRLGNLPASAFLRSDGNNEAVELTITGALMVSEIVFPDGSRQTTAETSSLPSTSEPVTYTSATLTCGTEPESDPIEWTFVIGRLQITIDGALYEIESDFSSVSTMSDVASVVQASLRDATGATERVEWISNRFEIHSSRTTSESAVSFATSPVVGLDISGESPGNNWLDCDAERAVVTPAVLDVTSEAGHLVVLDERGLVDSRFLPTRRVASSTSPVTVTAGGDVEILRFPVSGGLLSGNNILQVRLFILGSSTGLQTRGFLFRAFYGDVEVSNMTFDLVSFQPPTLLELEFNLMGGGTPTNQNTVSLGTRYSPVDFEQGSSTSHVDSRLDQDFYIIAARTGSGPSITLMAYTAMLIR